MKDSHDKTRNDHLPDWIDAFMLYTENTEPPVLYRKWTAISVIAAGGFRGSVVWSGARH